MFTVLANTRNSNLYFITALAAMAVILLTFAVVPAISAPKPALAPVTSVSEARSDYYQRHPELRVAAPVLADTAADFYLRHPGWTSNILSESSIPVTGSLEASDYFQRHPKLVLPVEIIMDSTDYFTRHPELRQPAVQTDLSDYFLRH